MAISREIRDACMAARGRVSAIDLANQHGILASTIRGWWKKADPKPVPKPMIADGLIAVAAFRYALGRQSYIVGHVADWLIANKDALGQHAAVIVRDIDEAEARGGIALGMDMDAECWRRVRHALVAGAAGRTGEGGDAVRPAGDEGGADDDR